MFTILINMMINNFKIFIYFFKKKMELLIIIIKIINKQNNVTNF